MSPAKALAVLGYGESVAAYRYRTLADRAPNPALRARLEEMADEEQGHHRRIADLMAREFPGSDYVLSAADKALVTVGARQLALTGPDFFAEALRTISESEQQTGRFYAHLADCPPHPDLIPMLKEMARECFDHARRVVELAKLI